MVNVASQQPAEIVRVLAGPTASALMPQEADAVNIRKDARCTLRPVCLRDFPSTQFWGFTLAVASYELRDMTPVNWRSHKSQLFLECVRSEEHTSELQSRSDLVCRLLLEK